MITQFDTHIEHRIPIGWRVETESLFFVHPDPNKHTRRNKPSASSRLGDSDGRQHVHDTFATAVKGYGVGASGERAPGRATLLGSAPWGPAPALSIPGAPDLAAGAGGLLRGRSWKYNGEQNSWFLLSQNLKFSEEDTSKQVTKTCLRCGGFSKASVSFLQPL